MTTCLADLSGSSCAGGCNDGVGYQCQNMQCGALCRSDGDCRSNEFCYGAGTARMGGCIKPCDPFQICSCGDINRCMVDFQGGTKGFYFTCQSGGGAGLWCNHGVPTDPNQTNLGNPCSHQAECRAGSFCASNGICTSLCDAQHPCADATKKCAPVTMGQNIDYSACI